MKFFIKTFGCRLNLAESDELIQKLKNYIEPTESEKNSDIIIIRACSVTSGAEQGVRQTIRKYKKQKKTVYVIGCFREKISEANRYFKKDDELINFLKNNFAERRDSRPLIVVEGRLRGNDRKYNRTRAFIKIQEGCDFGCNFCITRLLRGKSKSKSQAQIIKQIKEKENQGYQEIILTGTNILLYPDIHNLIKSILKKSTIPRIRFGSIDPRLVRTKFIKLFSDSRLQPHIHLSLQSGSEKVLKKMKRPIKISKIKTIVKKLRMINPLFNISADIIIGYPTETKNDFKKTLELAKKLQLSKIHYFPYSPRPNTSAENIKPLSPTVLKKRLTTIKELDKKLQQIAKEKIINNKLAILFEGSKNNIYYGYTPNFIRIKYKSKNNLTNKIKKIIIT